MTAAYPLAWPDHIPRSKTRDKGGFKASLAVALKNVEASIRLFAKDSGKPVSNVTISSNVALGAPKPADPGVSVWMTWDGLQVCIPVDRYQTVEANLQAIHHIIEARRTELRHGTLALVRATFTGFVALPPPARRTCWDVLGLKPGSSRADVERAYRDKAKTAHPDAGGSHEQMSELTAARDQALREFK